MKNWSDKTIFGKIADIISTIALCVWFVFTMYDKAAKLPCADMVCLVSATVIGVFQAFSFWKEKRVISYIALGGAACSIAAIILSVIY